MKAGTDDHDWQTCFGHHEPLYVQEPFVGATLAKVEFLIAQLLTPGMRVLDMDCGTRDHAAELTKRSIEMTSVDISGGMLALMHRPTPPSDAPQTRSGRREEPPPC